MTARCGKHAADCADPLCPTHGQPNGPCPICNGTDPECDWQRRQLLWATGGPVKSGSYRIGDGTREYAMLGVTTRDQAERLAERYRIGPGAQITALWLDDICLWRAPPQWPADADVDTPRRLERR